MENDELSSDELSFIPANTLLYLIFPVVTLGDMTTYFIFLILERKGPILPALSYSYFLCLIYKSAIPTLPHLSFKMKCGIPRNS